ncbi:hypothetical protein [Streptomyces carpinensis]|uniref:Uncharacterized protein n=1 Tax=Streptomyces carpinensis TaxID=66369 RepID=A0ABV1W3Z2_9ACTN|nr:hypothetical protein [Streptomyces carpinensis]
MYSASTFTAWAITQPHHGGGAARSLHQLWDLVTIHGSCVGVGLEPLASASRIAVDPDTIYLVVTGCHIPATRALSWVLVDEPQPVGA